MKSTIKIKDLIQVWSYESLSLAIFEVYDIYSNDWGENVYECFRIKTTNENTFKREKHKYLIHHKDVVAKFYPIHKMKMIDEN